MNKKNFTLLLIVFCFWTGLSYGQLDEKRVKIEITVKDGSKTITALVRSATVSFSKSAAGSVAADSGDKKSESKYYYFSLDFEKQDIALLKAFMKNKNGIDGQITMVDMNGKLPARKFEFTKATLDALSDQLTADYTSTYMSIACSSMIIDGVNLE
ncbi:hypothetical protein [Flavobacterium reichenbachii]|uniref:Uncharacterized protein n=1 Tax=Flavobacterium reichenbachii TaxID=362418 RepID=A0A085ZPT3_9FLAO|nr:hypothetical protein [Flavobacterium reichenbachii]KFF06447.1 hypothetical protein IW19_13400 [Flavobacterium reichenbachii]OXB11878.1 hypothetical protein B0A68_20470 [Flavobacterium reichenbachii]